MATPDGTPVTRKIWRVCAFPEFLVDDGKTKGGEERVLKDFIENGIVALPPLSLNKEESLVTYPEDYPLSEEYEALLEKHGLKDSDYGDYLYKAFWGIRPGDRIVLTFKDRIIAKGVATTACVQNKKAQRTHAGIGYELFFRAAWEPRSENYGVMKSGPTSFKEITGSETELKKCQEFETKNMTRPNVEITNLILCGPPGTGKTFRTKRAACEICMGSEWLKENKSDKDISDKFKELTRGKDEKGPRVIFVTFHPNYDYSDFIEGFRPQADGGFKIEDGVLARIAKCAERDPENNYLLVIDEINRGNIAKIFGETITLLEDDKRIGGDFELKCLLPGSRQNLGLPKNLYIRGTMNTADRSIAMLDIALRRRFDFEEVKPDSTQLKGTNIEVSEGKTIDQAKLMENLNKMLLRKDILGNRDYQIGHAWFAMPKRQDGKIVEESSSALADRLVRSFQKKIVPLLQEWLYDTPEKLWGEKENGGGGTGVFGGRLEQDDPKSIDIADIYELQEYLKAKLKESK